MRALKFHQTGSLDDLRFEEVSLPTLGPGEVLIQVKAAAINPSDIKNVQGKMHETTVPRIPGARFCRYDCERAGRAFGPIGVRLGR